MEHVLTCRASLGRKFLGIVDDGVADRTIDVAFECASNILAPRREGINDASVLCELSVIRKVSLKREPGWIVRVRPFGGLEGGETLRHVQGISVNLR